MRPQDLAERLTFILSRSPAFPGESLAVDVIANPKAGGFTRPKYARRRAAELEELTRRASALAPRKDAVKLRLHLTERSGHAAELALAVIDSARDDPPLTRRLVLTAGGDGTSLETAHALTELDEASRERFALLRLPFGTGNDGSEGRDLVSCLGRLLGPVGVSARRAIRVVPNPEGGKLPSYAFNIASLGFDAFVGDLTNKLKRVMPGDSYKFLLDLSAAFYDRIWPVGPMGVRASDGEGRVLSEFRRECLLFAVGASGNRQYGSNKPILPDDDNACVVFQMSLFQKLYYKDRIAAGRHRGLEVAKLFSGDRFEISYSNRVLSQRDGEVTELDGRDFPLVYELTEPIYNVLVPL
jgi:diacylglycerol kinase family enzyme